MAQSLGFDEEEWISNTFYIYIYIYIYLKSCIPGRIKLLRRFKEEGR